MSNRLKIHPSIGVARLGSSDEYFVGPMTPGVPANFQASFRDGAKNLKCQAAKFFIFAHDLANNVSQAVRPGDTLDGKVVAAIEWTVHPANKKASWFQFDGLTGSKEILNPPDYGYPPGSFRNPGLPVSTSIIDFGPRTVTVPAGGPASFDRSSAASIGYPATGPSPGTLSNAAGPVDINSLGRLIPSTDGTVIFEPAIGASGSIGGTGIASFANNPDWFDNTSDGPVTASVVFSDGSRRSVDDPSWVIVTPPDFAPAVSNIVTLHDTMYDVAVRYRGIRPDIYPGPSPAAPGDFGSGAPPFNASYVPSYRDEIYPILSRPVLYKWVQARLSTRPSPFEHQWDLNAFSKFPFVQPVARHPTPAQVFQRLQDPMNWNSANPMLMPMLLGDEDSPTRLTLTPTQYHLLRQWSLGNFDATTWTGIPAAAVPNPTPTADELDRASLEACCGGAFYPGIEIGWIVRESRLYSEPFRFRHPPAGAGGRLGLDPGMRTDSLYPGDATKRMACPWQSDFYKCNTEWWPAQRPDEVVTNAATLGRDSWARNLDLGVPGTLSHRQHEGMVINWHELGVVASVGTIQVETDRTLP